MPSTLRSVGNSSSDADARSNHPPRRRTHSRSSQGGAPSRSRLRGALSRCRGPPYPGSMAHRPGVAPHGWRIRDHPLAGRSVRARRSQMRGRQATGSAPATSYPELAGRQGPRRRTRAPRGRGRGFRTCSRPAENVPTGAPACTAATPWRPMDDRARGAERPPGGARRKRADTRADAAGARRPDPRRPPRRRTHPLGTRANHRNRSAHMECDGAAGSTADTRRPRAASGLPKRRATTAPQRPARPARSRLAGWDARDAQPMCLPCSGGSDGRRTPASPAVRDPPSPSGRTIRHSARHAPGRASHRRRRHAGHQRHQGSAPDSVARARMRDTRTPMRAALRL